MRIQAELSLYPLKTERLVQAIGDFIRELAKPGISVAPGTMSTLVAGECEAVLRVIGDCFEKVCRHGEVVLVVKYSNACPGGDDPGEGRDGQGGESRRLPVGKPESEKRSE